MKQKNITGFFKRKSSELSASVDKTSVSKDDTHSIKKVCADLSNRLPPRSDMPLPAEMNALCDRFAILSEHMCTDWFHALRPEFEKDYFAKLNEYVLRERSRYTIYPAVHHVFTWSQYPLSDVRVVILGQDPYHGPGQAHGLCFSVLPGVRAPPSLVNIFTELENDPALSFRRPKHGCLSGWSRQGVLLLNACLTVRSGQANSHKDQGWEKFTDAVIKTVSDRNRGVVFLLWGAFAQKKSALLDKSRHHILTSVHPSPLSAHRGFLGCRHFSKCNQLLERSGHDVIDWNQLDVDNC